MRQGIRLSDRTIQVDGSSVSATSGSATSANDAPQWGWTCGFYPGCDPGQQENGTAETFEESRSAFELAWNKLAATRTEAHYELWRRNRDWHSAAGNEGKGSGDAGCQPRRPEDQQISG